MMGNSKQNLLGCEYKEKLKFKNVDTICLGTKKCQGRILCHCR